MAKDITCGCGQQLNAEAKFCSNCGAKTEVLSKKHCMAVHTWISDEIKAQAVSAPTRTDKEIFAAFHTDKAECVQNWAGKTDFFYCHWIAETEDDIHSALEAQGLDKRIITLAHEMKRYVSKDKITGEHMVNPYK